MEGVPVERYHDVAVALQRLGVSWWLWVLLSQATVTYGHVLLVVVIPVRLALGAYVALSLVRLAEVLPRTTAQQLRGLAVLAGLTTLINVVGSALGGRSSLASAATCDSAGGPGSVRA